MKHCPSNINMRRQCTTASAVANQGTSERFTLSCLKQSPSTLCSWFMPRCDDTINIPSLVCAMVRRYKVGKRFTLICLKPSPSIQYSVAAFCPLFGEPECFLAHSCFCCTHLCFAQLCIVRSHGRHDTFWIQLFRKKFHQRTFRTLLHFMQNFSAQSNSGLYYSHRGTKSQKGCMRLPTQVGRFDATY